MRADNINLGVYLTNNRIWKHVILYIDFNTQVMLSKSDIEYLKRVNDVRKEMGLSLDTDQLNKQSFLSAVSEARHNTSKK